MARFGRLAARDALEEQVRRHLAELVDGLANDSERRLQHIRHFEIVKTCDCDLSRYLNPGSAQRVEGVAHAQVVGCEEGGGRLAAVHHGTNKSDCSLG